MTRRGTLQPGQAGGAGILEHDAPYLALAKALELFYPPRMMPPGIHKTALIDLDADVHPSAAIGPYTVIKKGARIGRNAQLETGVFIGEGASVGAGADLGAYCVISSR